MEACQGKCLTIGLNSASDAFLRVKVMNKKMEIKNINMTKLSDASLNHIVFGKFLHQEK